MQQSGVFSNLTSIVLWREQSSVRAQLAAKNMVASKDASSSLTIQPLACHPGTVFSTSRVSGVARQDRRMRKEKKEMPQPACVIV